MTMPQKVSILKLYVAGTTQLSIRALKKLNTLLEQEFQGSYALKVIDVIKNPQLAEKDKICATPTLVREQPPSSTKFVGDFSCPENFLLYMDFGKGLGF
ncbi:MAG: circadian clock KaiB family protein [Leptolyngbyaceae cyanobacterium MO_188.B28]|nr:circadian clock KaiB family protein [Leptolyngbyaceae cyanobacterium MO_188.B28]